MSYDPMPALDGYTPSASSYREKEKVRAERNEAKAAERRAQLAQRQAERESRAVRTGTSAPEAAGESYHSAMHAIGLRFPAVADRWRQVGLAILDGATPDALTAQLAGTAPATPSRASATAASKQDSAGWLTEHDRAQRRSWDNPRGD